MPRFDAITFDCYGTLIDWETGILGALRPILDQHAVALDDAAILSLYAELEPEAESGAYRPYREVLARVVDGLGERLGFHPGGEEREAIAASLPEWKPFDDTIDALRALRRSHRLGIISNVDDDLFEGSASRLGVRFDWVITAQQARAYKPSHVIFEEALARIGLPREVILHSAQSLFHDVVPARALGLATAWIDRRAGAAGPGATPAPGEKARPDWTFPDLASLAAAL